MACRRNECQGSLMYGGYNTLAEFDAGLANGKYAGTTYTSKSSSYVVGVDCSGFLCRCLQTTSRYVTSQFPSICTRLASWDLLKPADIIGRLITFVSLLKEQPTVHSDILKLPTGNGMFPIGHFYIRSLFHVIQNSIMA